MHKCIQLCAEVEINTYCPTPWNNLSEHDEFTKRREFGKTTVSNFQTEILKNNRILFQNEVSENLL